MTKKNIVNVSEIFHSLQGEGNTMGKPSVFCRFQTCNLLCGNPQAEDFKNRTQKEIEASQGEDATWTCDTIATWMDGDQSTTRELGEHLFTTYTEKFLNGSQLVLTGGEPTLQQSEFPELIGYLQNRLSENIRVEVETNSTILPEPETIKYVDQFNVSPKLSNSGMSKNRRVKIDPLNKLVGLSYQDRAIFKFVVTHEKDIAEIFGTFINVFDIPKDKIWLMPGCTTREQFEKVSPLVADLCGEYGFHFSSRLQINLWNKTTGV